MASGPFRGLVRDARRTLHDFMKIGAFYYEWKGGQVTSPIREITVRVHDKFLRMGDLAGTNFHYAEIEENAPRAIFMRSEIEPRRGMFISTDEAVYMIDSVLPPDDISVTANLKRLTAKDQLAGHPSYDDVKRVYLEAALPAMIGG